MPLSFVLPVWEQKPFQLLWKCTKSSVPKGCQAWPGILKTGIRGGLLPPEAPRAPPSCWASLPCICVEGRAKRVPRSCHRATMRSCHNPSLGVAEMLWTSQGRPGARPGALPPRSTLPAPEAAVALAPLCSWCDRSSEGDLGGGPC